MSNLSDDPDPSPKYLLALFNEKKLINKVYLFNTPKEAKDFLVENNDFKEWTAYLVDLQRDLENRPYIKLS